MEPPHSPTDRAFERYRDTGDADALARVFDALAPELLRVAIHLAPTVDEAEDLVQATFVTLIEGAPRFDPARRVKPWLLGILTNHARRAQRRRGRTPDAHRVTPVPRDPAPDVAAELGELSSRIGRVIEELPPAYRPVLMLRLRHGFSPAEIAVTLGRPAATVRQQLARGLRRLRERLPVGLVVGAFTAGRGLAAVRVRVLRAAEVAAHVAAGSSQALVWGIAMKKLAALVVLVTLVGLAWFVSSAEHRDIAAANVGEVDSIPQEEHGGSAAPQRVDGEVAVVDPRQTPASDRRVRVMVRWRHSNEPAADIRVRAVPLDASVPLLAASEARSSADGIVEFAGLSVGRYELESDRDVTARVDLREKPRHEVVLELPEEARVTGNVVDGLGRGIAGAEIWMTARKAMNDGAVVARTKTDGSFVVRGAARGRFLGARAEGHQTSLLRQIDGTRNGTQHFRFELESGAGSIWGRVLDPGGRPVAGAHVSVGHMVSNRAMSPEVSPQAKLRAPSMLRTDARGEFRATGWPAGSLQTVWIRAARHAVHRSRVSVASARSRPVDFRLARGGTVEVVLADAAGRPCPGVRVVARAKSIPARRIIPRWARHSRVSDGEGKIRFTRLSPGPIRCETRGVQWREASAELTVRDGETCRWRPVLQPPRVIRGSVVDANGSPLAGMRVRGECDSMSGPSHETPFVNTDADGRFELAGVRAADYLVQVFEKAPLPKVALLRRMMKPDTEARFVVPVDRRASASLQGKILDSDGRPVPVSQVMLLPKPFDSTFSVMTRDGSGEFATGRIPPDRYRVVLFVAGYPTVVLGEFDVATGQDLRLPTHRMPAPAGVAIRVLDADGQPVRRATVWICDRRDSVHVPIVRGRGEAKSLLPGRYEMRLRGRGVRAATRELTLAEGERKTIEWRLPKR